MISILQWSIKLGRIDIITEVSFLASFNVSPHERHLETTYRMFKHLYFHKKGGCVVFSDAELEVNEE